MLHGRGCLIRCAANRHGSTNPERQFAASTWLKGVRQESFNRVRGSDRRLVGPRVADVPRKYGTIQTRGPLGMRLNEPAANDQVRELDPPIYMNNPGDTLRFG